MKYMFVALFILITTGCATGTSQKTTLNSFYTPKSWNHPIHKATSSRQATISKNTTIKASEMKEASSKSLTVQQSYKEQMRGYASWYGPGFHGKKTANGEVYNQNDMTAAHKILPINTQVRVRNLENGKTIFLRINDRGPYKKNRIIDVSHKAATILGFVGKGTARVDIEVIKFPSDFEPDKGLIPYKQLVVQVAVFKSQERAEKLHVQLKQRFFEFPFLVDQNAKGSYQVIAGPFDLRQEAVFVATKLSSEGVDNFVRSYKK